VSVRYKPDYKGTGELMNGPEMQAVMREVALAGMASAVAAAPVRTGDYKSRFRVTVEAHGGVHHDRAEARIVNDSDHSVLVEWVDDYHTLRDAAGELGVL
jgi:hypothetical protein